MNFLIGSRGRLQLALLLILSGCASAPPAKQAAVPPTAVQTATNMETTRGVPSAPAIEQGSLADASSPPVKADPCQEERSLDTFDACAGFLRACPSVSKRQDILALMSRLIEQQKGGYEDYKKFALEFEDGLPFVPNRHRLSLTGPEGLRVHDCVESLRGGAESGMILEKVRGRKGVYKDFTFEEIDTLKQMGLTGDIIQAMIESTLEARSSEKALLKNNGGGAYPAAGQAVLMRRDGMYTSGEQQSYQAPAPGAYVPSAGDALTNCAAQAAALEGCKRLSGFARSLCNSTVKIQFPCQ